LVLTKNSATSTAKITPEITSKLFTSSVIMLVSLRRYMPRSGKRIKIPKLLALRTSLTLEETITGIALAIVGGIIAIIGAVLKPKNREMS